MRTVLDGPSGTLSQVLGKWMKTTTQGLVRYLLSRRHSHLTQFQCQSLQADHNWQVPGSSGWGLLPVCAHYGAKVRNAGLTMLRLQTG